jgi:hypothetical protein
VAAPFLSLLFAALAFAPAAAHLLELPNKIGLSREAYLTAQQLYRGWALLGIVVVGALLSTFAWTFTFPADELTDNWTVLVREK